MAAKLAASAKRLENTSVWADLASTAAAFRDIVAGDPLAMPSKLGAAYPLMLRLGGFLETDVRVQRDPLATDDPLAPDIHGLLTTLVQLAAPWLRGFPTVAKWDDEAGKALVRQDSYQPAREFVRRAGDKQGIPERDREDFRVLAAAVEGTAYQGQKSRNRMFGWAMNLLAVGATFFSGAVASDFAGQSLLAQRFAATLVSAEAEVEALAATRPDDWRHAILALTREAQKFLLAAPAVLPEAPDDPHPDDIEAAAQEMILGGKAPPASWRPFIRRLDFSDPVSIWDMVDSGKRGQKPRKFEKNFSRTDLLRDLTALELLNLSGTDVSDLAPLASLTALQSLYLSGTDVSDLAPLASLTALQSLNLRTTQVSDLAPLASLAALQSLNLTNTKVSDLAPLASLTALQSLDLSFTQVGDLAPLASLTALQSLYLPGTDVSDLAPLASLTGLRALNLVDTQVSDLAPLASLTALQSLYLSDTPVSDLAPLASLAALQSLHLMNTPVSDLAPLASLAALQSLDLMETQVSDLAPLASLAALQSLDLEGTQVGDLAPLAKLTALESLNLVDTPVSDLAPLASLAALQSLDLWNTQIRDLVPLAKLTALQSLDLMGTQVGDLAPLAKLTGLRKLDLRGTQISDISPLAGLTETEILWDEPVREEPKQRRSKKR